VLAGWLSHAGSLTHRLQELCPGAFALEVIGEGMEPATPDDAALLGTDERSLYTRRIRLRVRGQALVQACTLASKATVNRHPWLKGLGDQPLGSALAERDGVRRTDFEFALISADSAGALPTLRDLPPGPGPCAGRRSRFFVAGAPILVYEFFLPALLEFGPP
jgi:chorismate--pyruvate lyase